MARLLGRYEFEWLDGMCSKVGVAAPQDPAAFRRLARECDAYVTRRVRSALPGSVGAIRALHRAGFTLLTASGEASWELDGYLTGMRLRAYSTVIRTALTGGHRKFSPVATSASSPTVMCFPPTPWSSTTANKP